MRILIINHYAGFPGLGMEYRPYYLAREWIELGNDVTILAADNSHLRTTNPKFDKDFAEQQIDGIRYIWVKTPQYSGSGFGRIKNMIAFVRKTYWGANTLTGRYKPNVVIASSTYPLDNYVARRISKLVGARFIYEVHDLWPLSAIELGNYSKYHPFILAMQHAERFAYKKVDAVISLLPKTKEHMVKHGLSLNKWNYIPNGVVVQDWDKVVKIPQEHDKLLIEFRNEHKTIIGYTGGHAISNSLDSLIRAAEILNKTSKYAFILVGRGTEKKRLMKMALSLRNIFFLDPVSKNAIPDLLSRMDLLFLGWNKSPLYRFGINPNKLYDYMMAGKPIIHAVMAGNDPVNDANCGLSIEPENPQAIANAIIQLRSFPKEKLKEMGENGRRYVLKNHDYKILGKKFIDILEKL